MDKPLSILLVEDDKDTCKKFAYYIDELDDVTLVNITNNSYRAIDYIKEYLPDAVILDLELNLGTGNGLSFLKEVKSINIAINPYILVTTNNSSQTTYNIIRQLGADFIMYKHQSDYTEKGAVDFLRMLKDIIHNNQQNNNVQNTSDESPILIKKRLSRLSAIELNRIGISPKAVGYKYLNDAIQLVIDEQEGNIICTIAQKYNKSDSSVERAMQNAINKAWRTTTIEDLLIHYTAKINSEKGVPTVTEFIYYYANKIKYEN